MMCVECETAAVAAAVCIEEQVCSAGQVTRVVVDTSGDT